MSSETLQQLADTSIPETETISPIEQLREDDLEISPFSDLSGLDERLTIPKNSVDEQILSTLTTRPTHDLLGRGLVELLSNYEMGRVAIEDPYLDGIVKSLIRSDDDFKYNYPEMLASYFGLVDELNDLKRMEDFDRVILEEKERVIGEMKRLLQNRMANLTNRDYISSNLIFSK